MFNVSECLNQMLHLRFLIRISTSDHFISVLTDFHELKGTSHSTDFDKSAFLIPKTIFSITSCSSHDYRLSIDLHTHTLSDASIQRPMALFILHYSNDISLLSTKFNWYIFLFRLINHRW